MPDEKLEQKVIEVSSAMNIAITKNDVQDCHKLGKISKSSIVQFVKALQCNFKQEIGNFKN